MINIKNKRSLILLTAFGILAMLMIFPTTLAFSGTVRPNEIRNQYGTQTGTLSDIQYEDNDLVQWTGVQIVWFQFRITTNIYFPYKTDVGTNNEVEIEFSLRGGAPLWISIYYTDGTHDAYSQNPGSMRTVIYDLDNYKIVDYVRLYNHEWWYAGVLKVDYLIVNY